MKSLLAELAEFGPELVVFDKDGTLIEFQAMWAVWVRELASRLEEASGLPVAEELFKILGFEQDSGKIWPDGHLALSPVAELGKLTTKVLQTVGLSPQRAEAVKDGVWFLPDPAALAQPLADLGLLFKSLRTYGVKIGVATSDDRAGTERTLSALGVASLVDGIVCADGMNSAGIHSTDAPRLKPAPDMILFLCDSLGVAPAKTVMVGDNVVDLEMGQAAGAGLLIGVLSGVSSESRLAPYADLILPTIEGLLQYN